MYDLAADAVLALHTGFVAAVIALLPLALVGGWRGWRWVRLRWLRIAHLAGIGIVVAQAWAGVICPLTTLEMWLRERSGQAGYDGSFIEHWLQQLLYWQAPGWVFVLTYTVFGALVVLAWVLVPPGRGEGREDAASSSDRGSA